MTKFFFGLLLALSVSSSFGQTEQQTDCDKYPESLGCATYDPVTGEGIPATTRDVSPQPGAVFSGGGCPADISMSFRGSTLVMLPMASACSWITSWVRPLFLLIAGLTALFIVFPSED